MKRRSATLRRGLAGSYQSYPADVASLPHDRDYEDEPAAAGQYSGPAGAFDNASEDARGNAMLHDAQDRDEQEPEGSRGQHLPFLPPAWRDGHSEADDQEHDGAQTQSYAADEYDEEAPPLRRPSGMVVVMAVLGLAVLGSAAHWAIAPCSAV